MLISLYCIHHNSTHHQSRAQAIVAKMPALLEPTQLDVAPAPSTQKCTPNEPQVSLIRVGGSSPWRQDGASQTGLLGCIARGLLYPSVPLSQQAAHKLQQQQLEGHQHAGQLLKSLPVELLYDDTGLQLFDKITHLPEYYLTEAEASILTSAGADILRSCVQDGALLLELGAGSMRKTRLLLDAVEGAGLQGVTFAALDLCEASLSDALTALAGSTSTGSISMVGLVGTYEQGLQHIWDLQQQQQQQQQQLMAAEASPVGPDECDDLVPGTAHCITAADNMVLSRGGSLGADSVRSGDSTSTDVAVEVTAPDTAPEEASGGKQQQQQQQQPPQGKVPQLLPVWGGAPRVIMWLGSSIGNCDRDQAVTFLQQVREKAMRKGDFLLIGIDRRNDQGTVATAYNDKQGVTSSFILNGLQHCARLLDAADSHTSSAQHGGSSNSSSPGNRSGSSSQTASLDPQHFEYFCLYNEHLGRHEAYCQATTDTCIRLPAAAAGGAASTGSVDVAVAAGELISIEFSYKYSQQEVQQLASGAGLVRVRAWADVQQRYDLHLLQCV